MYFRIRRFSGMREMVSLFGEWGCDFILLHNMLKISYFDKSGLHCAHIGPLKFKNGKNVPCICVSNLEIRGRRFEKKPKMAPDGLRYYKNTKEWFENNRPTDCYVTSTWACLAESLEYDYEWRYLKGLFNPVYIKARKAENRPNLTSK